MSLTPQFLDELRARTLLSALVGKTVKIQKAGREYRGCCPFHNEKTPSFYINDEKGFFHCFGCSAHGDAIKWMTDQRGLPFMDAVKELAAAAGMEVPAADPRAAERAERANSLYDVMKAAADWFSKQLESASGSDARLYLEKRGFTPATIERFGLGYAPDSKSNLKSALKSFGTEMLVEAGLLISVEDKEPYDRFRGRLMIPIRDPRGRVIAFGGRILGHGEPKYLNSPDTPLFDKGRTLYNLDIAAAAARKAGRILVVEGYLDVISLNQAGFDEAVAPLGTALTESQIDRLWRTNDCPTICFDGDLPGQKAAARAAVRALPGLLPGKSLTFATLPSKLDPDDVIQKQGSAGFEKYLVEAATLDHFLWNSELYAQPLGTPEARAGFGRRMRELARTIRDEDVRTQYSAVFSQRLRELFSPNDKTGKKYFSEGYFSSAKNQKVMAKIATVGLDQATIIPAVFSGLIRHHRLIGRYAEAVGRLTIESRELRQFRLLLFDEALGELSFDVDRLATRVRDEGLGGLWLALHQSNGIAFSFLNVKADPEQSETDLAAVIEKLATSTEIADQLARLDEQLKSTDTWTDSGFEEQARLRAAEYSAMEQLMALLHADDENVV
jgi:DNA primase